MTAQITCQVGKIVGGKGAAEEPRLRLFALGFQTVFQPGTSNQFTFPGAKRLPVTSPACAFQILGITPETDRSGSGCVILIWLHAISKWKARIGQLAAKRNRQNRGIKRVKWDKTLAAALRCAQVPIARGWTPAYAPAGPVSRRPAPQPVADGCCNLRPATSHTRRYRG